jgi:hypothetical protein
MKSHRIRANRLGAALVAATLVVLTPSAASAATAWFSDAKGDVPSSVDIYRVRVINGEPGNPAVRVTVVQAELRAGDGFDVWLDTDAADPGPEYRATWAANSDSLGLRKVTNFRGNGVAVDCPGFRVRSAQDDPGNSSHVSIPRPCLDNPHQVRVGVRAQRQAGQEFVVDWAPRAKHFYDWVRQG